MVESDPLILVTTSDEHGHWRIRTANIFPNGIHNVYAVSTKGGREIVDKELMGNFEITRSQPIAWWIWVIIVGLATVNIWQYRRWKRLKNESENEYKR